MTLVVAQRKNGKVSFASDSRITFGSAGTFDRGVKIFKVPVRIRGLLKSFQERNNWEHELTYGMAIAGGTTNAFSLKDSLLEIFGNIQYVSNTSDYSIVGLGLFAFRKFKEISQLLSPILRDGGLCEILFAGYCLAQKKVRVLKFYPTVSATDIEYRAEEILIEDGVYLMGSGKQAAEEVIRTTPDLTPLRIIKTVIEHETEPTVGGLLQIGGFPRENFILAGVEEEIVDPEGNKTMHSHFLGFNLSQIGSINVYPRLFITHGQIKIDSQWPDNLPLAKRV